MGFVMTSLTLGGAAPTHTTTRGALSSNVKNKPLKKEYPLVMDTKLKIIEILQVGSINRLKWRIRILSIFISFFFFFSVYFGCSS